VTVRTANVDLDEGEATRISLRAGRYVELSVADTGIGMDEETRAHCFEPFFTTKDVGKGTGLGLSTASGIVRQSDGEIIVESRPGIGTTFRVYLPRAVGVEAARGNRPESVAPGRGERILLVEDERSVIAAIKVILDHAGYDVKTATRGDEALRIWENDPDAIDLVISDVVMPGMNGPDLVKSLRAIKPGIKAILMSGYTHGALNGDQLREIDVPLLQKPFKPTALLRIVDETMGAGV
jgi:CheY-like chemotaxis protein